MLELLEAEKKRIMQALAAQRMTAEAEEKRREGKRREDKAAHLLTSKMDASPENRTLDAVVAESGLLSNNSVDDWKHQDGGGGLLLQKHQDGGGGLLLQKANQSVDFNSTDLNRNSLSEVLSRISCLPHPTE